MEGLIICYRLTLHIYYDQIVMISRCRQRLVTKMEDV